MEAIKECIKCRETKHIEEFPTFPSKGQMKAGHVCKICSEDYRIKSLMVKDEHLKLCKFCDEVKSVSDFPKMKSGSKGTRNECKTCYNEIVAPLYKSAREAEPVIKQEEPKQEEPKQEVKKEEVKVKPSMEEIVKNNEKLFLERLNRLSTDLALEKEKNRELFLRNMQLENKLFVLEANIREYGFEELLESINTK